MLNRVFLVFFLIIGVCVKNNLIAQNTERKFIDINHVKMAYKTFGLESRKEGDPIIVFESGMGMGGGNFELLFPYLSKEVSGIVYDRNGLGESETDTTIVNDADVVKRLHTLLATLNIKPPYLLVGHSIGGPFIRLFTSFYPENTCGLVFIDPTDFMLTAEEDEHVKRSTSSVTGYHDLWRINLKHMGIDATLPFGLRREVKRELAASTPLFFKEYTHLHPLKNVPITVLISYNKPIEPYEAKMNEQLKLGINISPWWKELDRLRIMHYSDMIKMNQYSRVVLLPGYSHGIHHQDPELVAKSILDTFKNCKRRMKE
ncbi:alpha/beta fold hydrolase [Chryseosolibacter indicus]|uniref:Alpha/beta hydrolase n=1 Tax=Chryseosolibacter indicus TaxID=2782351 RepID=A0ABS5VTB8_9BACT|nr:alpha/beta hydrolase [Chryseosolibacter indicus]MBT1703216.1 alpha/beta hydrolase [Chryseosolibacter indicus]